MNASEFLDSIRIGAQLAVGEQPKCPPGYCAGLATCSDTHCPGRGKLPIRSSDNFHRIELAVWAFVVVVCWALFFVQLVKG